MQFKRQPKRELGLDITPLIDVVFLLLIFFMVTTSFTDKNQLTIDLPEAVQGEIQMQQPDRIEVLINAAGEYHINGQRLLSDDFNTLKSAISQQLSEAEKSVYIITADTNAPHGAVVMAMDIAGQLGITNLSVTTVRPRE